MYPRAVKMFPDSLEIRLDSASTKLKQALKVKEYLKDKILDLELINKYMKMTDSHMFDYSDNKFDLYIDSLRKEISEIETIQNDMLEKKQYKYSMEVFKDFYDFMKKEND